MNAALTRPGARQDGGEPPDGGEAITRARCWPCQAGVWMGAGAACAHSLPITGRRTISRMRPGSAASTVSKKNVGQPSDSTSSADSGPT